MALRSRLAISIAAGVLAAAAAATPAAADDEWGSQSGGSSSGESQGGDWGGGQGEEGGGQGGQGGDGGGNQGGDGGGGDWGGSGGDWSQGGNQSQQFTRGRVTASSLLLRSAPNRGSQVIRVVHQGDIVRIFCKTQGESVQGNRFWYLLADGTWAWGSARYIETRQAPRWC
ncbi:SH3 domain-containing protein [Streptomyces osmaniensis]|uniref:SH3b domain-containing protein n=1 Tax=Streptomyces osmaniensis TaxID=593134 RepID=A0ABP6X8R0_9ACTN|nr:SH3 domain-containing protein [Streptomyces sp. JCM17656]